MARPRTASRPAVLERVFVACGGPAALARRLGVSTQAVAMWVRVPVWHLPRVTAVSGIAAADLEAGCPTRAKPGPKQRGERA